MLNNKYQPGKCPTQSFVGVYLHVVSIFENKKTEFLLQKKIISDLIVNIMPCNKGYYAPTSIIQIVIESIEFLEFF